MSTNTQLYFRVTYEIPPLRAIYTAEFVEFASLDSRIREMVEEENPTWKIKRIERGLTRPAT